jgi:hypothetical protein
MADDVDEVENFPKNDDDEEKAEREHFIRILNAFKFYRLYILMVLSSNDDGD